MSDITTPIYGGMFDSTSVEETVNGFPRGNKAVDSAFFAKLISCFYSDGVFTGGSYDSTGFKIVPGGGLTIRANPGIAWIRGYMAWQKEAAALTLTPGFSYSVVLRLNIPAGEFSLCATTTAPEDSDSIKDIVLAEIVIGSDAAAITEDMISDTRGDSTKCGYVTSTLDALSTIALAENAAMLGGFAASDYLLKSGGVMTGKLSAAPESTGISAVRNISYGTSVPDSLAPGEIFIQLSTT